MELGVIMALPMPPQPDRQSASLCLAQAQRHSVLVKLLVKRYLHTMLVS